MAIQRATENTVREAPMSGARLQAANFDAGEIYGRALEGFGKQLGNVVDEADKIVYKYDLAAAKNADTEDAIELARIRAEALTATGTDAETASENARLAANDLKKQRLTKLKGRRAELYSTAFDQRLVSFETQITEHSVKQADVAARGAALARSETSLDIATKGYADPEVYGPNMATAEEEFRAGNPGVPEDQLAAKWREIRSRAHVGIAGMIMSEDALEPNPQKAKDWLDDHKGEILPAHHTEILKSLNPLLKADMVTTEYARSMTQGAILEGGGDYDVKGEVKPPATETLDEDDTAGIVGATATPGETPKGLDPLRPLPDAAGAKPTEHKAQEPFKNSTELFDAVLGKGNYRVGNAYGAPRPGGKTHKGTDLPARAGTSIHPPMSGTVVARGFDKLEAAGGHGGGFYIRVRHPNGTVTGYAHMGGETPFKVGDHVDRDDIIGVVGSSGRSSGPHLHFTVRDDKGGKVNPQTAGVAAMADSDGPPLKDPVKTSWKEGDLVLVTDDKDTLGTALNRINLVAQKEGWSQNKYDLVVGEAKSRSAMNDQMYKAGYDTMIDRVWTKVAELGDGFTNVNQLGADYGRMDGGDKLRAVGIADANRKALEGGPTIKEGGPIYLNYWQMAHDTRTLPGETESQREKFLKIDFRSVPDITNGERKELFKLRQDMTDDQSGRLAADQSKISAAVLKYSPVAPVALKNPTNPLAIKHNTVVREVSRAVARQQGQLNRPLNDEELDIVARSATVDVYRGGEKIPLAVAREEGVKPGAPSTVDQTRVLERIPPPLYRRLAAELQSEGKNPSTANVVKRFLDLSK